MKCTYKINNTLLFCFRKILYCQSTTSLFIWFAQYRCTLSCQFTTILKYNKTQSSCVCFFYLPKVWHLIGLVYFSNVIIFPGTFYANPCDPNIPNIWRVPPMQVPRRGFVTVICQKYYGLSHLAWTKTQTGWTSQVLASYEAA